MILIWACVPESTEDPAWHSRSIAIMCAQGTCRSQSNWSQASQCSCQCGGAAGILFFKCSFFQHCSCQTFLPMNQANSILFKLICFSNGAQRYHIWEFDYHYRGGCPEVSKRVEFHSQHKVCRGHIYIYWYVCIPCVFYIYIYIYTYMYYDMYIKMFVYNLFWYIIYFYNRFT